MGRIIYNSTLTILFDDRTLAHLQAVISSKLSDRESFHFLWSDEASAGNGGGRNVIWVHPGVSLVYAFSSSEKPQINPEWITVLLRSASTADGLSILPEPS
ncbi:ATP-dependent DNA ligase [Cryobacterium adonitolivorans]|uniref:ATP-dependent DNA ligase n=1 Tax=Cryobacterium adonitolivorans TaxID=1259189 RepID=A0A4R8W5Y0_9MICO|nr:ATP-dependent DNA ligase [Cryobacterium adonitolivorans]TFC01479.1 ATP-dependent DNA ligase [Cryobacterium adonitolivorans]